jgi:SAM-dependent methyltransferase
VSDPHPLSGTAIIDPFAATPPGCYNDNVVTVVNESRCALDDSHIPPIVRTPHFRVRRRGHQVLVSHGLSSGALDNDLASLLAAELFSPGWLSGTEVFERVFTGVVRSTVDDPMDAWVTFYTNTISRIDEQWDTLFSDPGAAHTLSGMLPVYQRVTELVPEGRILDVGSCFGFLALLLARRQGTHVIASDVAGGTVSLLRAIAPKLGLPVGTLTCDGARVPLPSKAVDTVTIIHLLEHLEPQHSEDVLTEAARLARKRIVVAVPFEDEPTAAYGHIRTFDLPALTALGQKTGLPLRISEHHGGWLVLDTQG